jgi:transcriptional regulator with XRE-family HTH domain
MEAAYKRWDKLKAKHPLKRYREVHGIILIDAAVALGVTAAQISRIENGHSNPSVPLMRRIYRWSDGEVTPNDMTLREPQGRLLAGDRRSEIR